MKNKLLILSIFDLIVAICTFISGLVYITLGKNWLGGLLCVGSIFDVYLAYRYLCDWIDLRKQVKEDKE